MKELVETLKHIRTVLSVALLSNMVLYFLDTPVSIVGIALQFLIEVQLALVWYLLHVIIRKQSSHN